jgi:hypothetical protein
VIGRQRARSGGWLATGLVAIAVLCATGPTEVGAQDVDSPLGAADFRTAPVLDDGTHHDTALPSETVWYAFRASQAEQAITIGATIDDPSLDDRLDVVVGLIGPDLAPVAESNAGELSETLVFDLAGDDRTATWYFTVRTTAGGAQLADAVVAYTLTVLGADPADVSPCVATAGCPQAADAERLLAETEQAEAELDARALVADTASAGQNSTALDETERLELLERRRTLIATIDAHEPSAPAWPKGAMLGAGLVALAAGYGVTALLHRRRRNETPVTPDPAATARPSANPFGDRP